MTDEENTESTVESAEPVVEKGEFSESQEETSEQSLEDIAEQPRISDAEIFSESSMEVHDMPTPTIQASDAIGDSSGFQSQEPLEQSASEGIAESGGTASREHEQEVYTAKDENEISYANLYEQRRFQELRAEDVGTNIARNFMIQPTVNLDDFDQRRMRDNAPTAGPEDYQLLEVKTGGEPTRKLPFERATKKDYRVIKKWKK